MTDTRDWLALARAPGLGPRTVLGLLDACGTAAAIRRAPTAWLRQRGLSRATITRLRAPDADSLSADLEWLAQPNHALLTWTDAQYPPLLRRIPDPPPLLFVDGDADALWRSHVAIVGSRRPTSGGIANARRLAGTLSRSGFVIASGMAVGIDAAAHEATLDAGGRTTAVLGTGPDRVYPAANAALSRRIAAAGALVSEFPPGTPPRRRHFPRRNRIISGLSLGVLVVEAGERSGSLITARLAGEQGREVFALPGSVHNPMARGCHQLIREGAILVEDAAQITQELAPLALQLADELQTRLADDGDTEPQANDRTSTTADPEYDLLIEALGHDPVPVDILVQRTGLTTEVVSSMLLLLELRGEVSHTGGGVYSLTAENPR